MTEDAASPCWIGVDVGGPRKGFDVAVVGAGGLIGLTSRCRREDVVAIAASRRPALVAIDSPGHCAPAGATARADELQLNRAVCGIRWTPDEGTVRANPYYGWIAEGLDLFSALGERGVEAVEVFPTASWTRWFGGRGRESRASWTRRGLASLGLEGVPGRTSQDARDAIAAAVTARQHSGGLTECIGQIVVPAGRWPVADRGG